MEHLQSWENFQADGIVTMNYQNLIFRKNINIKKNNGLLKLTVYDSGIFGMKPEPFITVKIDSLIQIKTATATETEIFSSEAITGLQFILEPQKLFLFKDQILKQNPFHFDQNTDIHFSERMQISKIEQQEQNLSVNFYYAPLLSRIEIRQNNILLSKIEIDKITHQRE